MRILFVSQYFRPENNATTELAQHLLERGHDVGVLTGMPNYPSGIFYNGYGGWRTRCEYYGAMAVWRVPMLARGTANKISLSANYLSFLASSLFLAPLLVEKRFDVIFVYQPSPVTVALPAILLKKLYGWPILLWVQDLWPDSLSATGAIRSQTALRAVGRLVRYIYKRCDCIAIESEAFRPKVVADGADARRVLYLPNWADKMYRPVEAAAGSPEDLELPRGFRVIYTGNIGKAQDFTTILDAAELLRDRRNIQWIIFGEGGERPFVEQEVARRGLRETLHVMGGRAPEAIPVYLAYADAVLICLRNESLFALTIPSKLQSYMACGRPLVGAIDGIVADIIHEAGAGLAGRAGDPRQLATHVQELARMSKAERDAMGARAREYFLKNFERSLILRRAEAALSDLTERTKSDAESRTRGFPRSVP